MSNGFEAFENSKRRPRSDFKKPDGLKPMNCFRCQGEFAERDMVRLSLKTSQPNCHRGGDLLLVCKGCHNGSGE